MASSTDTKLVRADGEPDLLEIRTTWDNPAREDSVERIEAYGTFHTIEMIKQANDTAGFHFFSKDAMRFFRSRVAPGVVHGRVFITSEQFDYESPRLYTVRAMKDDGSTADLSGFQRFETLRQARAYVKRIYN